MDKTRHNSPTTRKKAKEENAMFYLSGQPCKNGHDSPLRYTSSGRCVECYQTVSHPLNGVVKARYSPILWHRDGTVEMLGPFVNKTTAIQKYIQRHIEVYGVPPPHLVTDTENGLDT